MFVAAGAGILRVDDPRVAALRDESFLEEVPANFRSFFETELTADRTALAFGGSLGLSIRAGRLFLRPRLDAFFGRPLLATYRVRFGSGDGSFLPPGQAPVLTLESSMTPRFLFLGVDIGFTTE